MSSRINTTSLFFPLCRRSLLPAALLARQFVEMGRIRIEGLLAAFPKLIGAEGASPSSSSSSSSSAPGKQHTFIETDACRYVYLPLESLYLLLITNKNSNIIEDLDTLRLLSRVVPEQLGMGVGATEEAVQARAFELIFAFDEVVAAGGYREEVTLHQIRTNLEMESHEEKLAQMIKASKMAEAKEAAKRRAQEIRERARDDERRGGGAGGQGGAGGAAGGRMTGFGSGSPGGYDGGGGGGRYGGGGGGGGYDDGPSSSYPSSSSSASSSSSSAAGSAAAAAAKKPVAGGMKLGSKKAGGLGLGGAASGALASVIAEEGIKDRDLVDDGAGGAGGAAAAVQAAKAAAEAASADQASIAIEEHVTARISRDGGVLAYEVKGAMALTVLDEAAARLRVGVRRGDDRAFTYQSHPNVNKAALGAPNGDGIVALKQSDRPFPTGAPVGVLRWRYAAKDEDTSQLPLMLTCWPEEGAGGSMTVNVEYTLQRDDITLTDVIVTVPLCVIFFLGGGEGVFAPPSCVFPSHPTPPHPVLFPLPAAARPRTRPGSPTATASSSTTPARTSSPGASRQSPATMGACPRDSSGRAESQARGAGPSHSPISLSPLSPPPQLLCSTGALEFSLKGSRGLTTDSFFPVRVAFASPDTLCPISVLDVATVDEGKGLRNTITKGLVVDEYVIE